MKAKFKQLKEAMKNPPADRLAKIEYQSNFLQAIGILFVCTFLIIKGLWYIIFALIFGVGINYSQGMNAYRKYHNIKEFMPKEEPKDFVNDISPSRKRGKIIEHVYGGKMKWFCIIISVLFTYVIFGMDNHWLFNSIVYPLSLFGMFILSYFFGVYYIALYHFNKEMKI